MSDDVVTYLDMQRREYAANVAKSDFSTDEYEKTDDREFVVGSYAMHERFDYEGWLLDGVDIGPDAIAVDYGCGPGRMLKRMRALFARVDGTDISTEVLEVAGQRCANWSVPPKLFVTDGQGMPAGIENAYDVAYSVICLQHVCVHSIRRRILESLFAALEPGGLLTFQMGYGPGHRALIAYEENAADATGTNGEADVTVLHPGEIAKDLYEIGFVDAEYALTPTGPGDTHAAWIFVRASKPGTGAAIVRGQAQPYFGFRPLVVDEEGVAQAHDAYRQHSIKQRVNALTTNADSLLAKLQQAQDAVAQRGELLEERSRVIAQRDEVIQERGRIITQRDKVIADRDRALAQRNLALAARDQVIVERDRTIEQHTETVARRDTAIVALQRERDWLADVGTFTRTDRDAWRKQAEQAAGENEQLRRKAAALERQLRRLRTADRGRMARLVEELVAEAQAGSLRVGILGAGEHTEWLFRETPLQTLPSLFLFDSGQAMWGRTVSGLVVRPSADIAVMRIDVVIVSSLAFQDEMAGFLESLNCPGLRIIRLYP